MGCGGVWWGFSDDRGSPSLASSLRFAARVVSSPLGGTSRFPFRRWSRLFNVLILLTVIVGVILLASVGVIDTFRQVTSFSLPAFFAGADQRTQGGRGVRSSGAPSSGFRHDLWAFLCARRTAPRTRSFVHASALSAVAWGLALPWIDAISGRPFGDRLVVFDGVACVRRLGGGE